MPAGALTTTIASVVRDKGCPKCGVKKFGKLSCCASGGAWYKNCGDTGDANFDHTWIEGILACKSTSITVTFVSSI